MNKFCSCGVVLSIMAVNVAIAGDLEDAKKLMSANKPLAAYEKLITGAGDYPQDVDYLYTLAVAAMDSGKFEDAIPLLERVVQMSPDNYGAKFDLGRAYFHTGKRDEARRYLLEAADQQPPAGAKQIIRQYLAALDEQQRALSSKTNVFLEGGLGYDDNINSSTGQSQIAVPLFGNALLTMNQTSLKTSSSYATLKGGINGVKPINQNLALSVSGSLAARSNFGHSTYDSYAPDLRGNIMYGFGKQFIRAGLFGSQYYLQGNHSRDILGVDGDWYYVVGAQDRVGIFSQYADYRFQDTVNVASPTMPNENFTQGILGLNWAHQVNDKTQLSTALFAGHEVASLRIDGNKDTLAARISGERKLNDNLSLFAGAGYQRGDYKKRNVLFLVNRADDQYDANMGLSYRYSKQMTVRGQYSYMTNNSNVALNSTTRNDLSVVLRFDY